MYLEKLEIQGFKSFANKTVIEFPNKSSRDKDAHSVTAIVGPNGSGKSNTSDAIRWVLGEQSSKLLRGKKAEDVIFAGSGSKARLGFAEVSLYINNEDGSAPIDYKQIVITRRVYRDGEGEYLINKNKVRLFDILMLLAKANFGQKSYSIIGQGMVDHIITISPWERKEFFDEATGVKQYQIKRDQAVNKMNRSRENLDQTHKILAELEPRLRLLTRQIKKLEKRKEVEKSLRVMQEKYYAHIWQALKREKVMQEEQFSIKDALKNNLEEQLSEIQMKLAVLAREESRKEAFNTLQKEYNKLVGEKNDILKELTLVKGKMSLEYVKAGKQNISWLDDKKSELEQRIAEIRVSIKNTESLTQHKRVLLAENEKKVTDLADELAVLQNNFDAAKDAYSRAKSGKLGGNGEAVQAILRQKNYIKGIFGTVSELGIADDMYQTALAVAAGSQLGAVVVKSDDVAVQCIKYLKDNKLGSVTFFPLNKIKGYRSKPENRGILAENGVIGYAVDLVTFEPTFKKVFEHVYGLTVVVDEIEHAKKIGVGRERMVTIDGDVFERSGVIKGGYRRKGFLRWRLKGDQKTSVSAEQQLQELALLKSKIEDRLRQKEVLLGQMSDLRVTVQVNETKSKGQSNDISTLEKELHRVMIELAEQQISPSDQDNYMKGLTVRQEEMEADIAVLDKKITVSREKIDAFNLEEEKKKAEVFRLQDDMQEYQRKLNEVNNDVGSVKITLARLETKQEDLEKEVNQELGPLRKLDSLRGDAVVNSEQVWLEISKLKKSLELIGGIDPEIVDEHKEVSERYNSMKTSIVDLEKAIKDLKKIVEELDVVIEKQFSASFNTINKSFEKYFKDIFQGGKAKLSIVQKEAPKQKALKLQTPEGESYTEEEVVAEAPEFTKTGIELYVSPPNKKLNTISALSGGERTMTSLALLCAIIDSNPSPVVVMDEVDAALDEANSERFARILEELSYKTQFVVITHNRVIMHVADVLYGVAMGTDGISKTLSLNLQEAEKVTKE